MDTGIVYMTFLTNGSHPSLEGRGDVVVVENVVLAALKGQRKWIY